MRCMNNALLIPSDNEIFNIRARKCKRCGGILTSRQAVEDGYGHTCKMKVRDEEIAKRPLDGQMSFGDVDGSKGSESQI